MTVHATDTSRAGAPPAGPPTHTLTGVETITRLLVLRHELDRRDGLDTGTMVSGYPGSPLGTFDLTLDKLGPQLDEHRIVHRRGLNEELAVSVVWGSQMGAAIDYAGVDGVAGAWYGKTPGLDRSGDALRHANAMGSGPNGGAVIFCGDDPTAKSSTLNCDSQFTFEDACIPVLYPGNQQELLDLGVHAFRMSRLAGPWVGMKIVTAVADGVGTVELDPDRFAPLGPPAVEVGLAIDGVAWQHRPQHTIGPHQIPHQELVVVDHRLRAAQAYVRQHGLDRIVGAPDHARLGVVCAGKTYHDVVQAFADLGVGFDDLAAAGIRILKLAMTYPVVPETVREFAASVDELAVIEEKRPFVESQLRSILHEAGDPTRVVGKRDRRGTALVPITGELTPTPLTGVLTRLVPDLAPPEPDEPAGGRTLIPLLDLPPRPPGFCSGCPHNRSTVFPDDVLVGGGVGCHGIIYFEPRHAGMKALPPTPMGGEGVPWIGLAPFVDEPHLIQNLGDGTLSHSGSLAIRACVAADVDVTFKILYNRAVAMTGGQDVTGVMDVPAMTRALAAEGVSEIVVCAEDPDRYGKHAAWADGVRVLDRGALDEQQRRLREVAGTTILIYDQQCAAEARRLRKQGRQVEPASRVIINEAVCEGCGDCTVKSNCLSVLPVETELGTKRRIDQLSCNRDYTCMEGNCPSFVTITPTDDDAPTRARPKQAVVRPTLPAGTLPEPAVPEVDRRFSIYVTGIGGTGIVTATRTIAAAAERAGFQVGGVDQTGLSQKAGAVVSHLHLARDSADLGAATVSSGHADLYLSGDILQAAGPAHLDKVDPGHTVAVVDHDVSPTAAMLQTGTAPPDAALLQAAITERVGADRSVFVDSQRIASEVFANHLVANIVLLGAAYQLGGLPLALDDIEDAIRAGRGADDNLAAFRWGRWAVHDPSAVLAALDAARAGRPASLLEPSPGAVTAADRLVAERSLPAAVVGLVGRRTAQVVDYQDTDLARRYLDLVERAAARDGADREWVLTRAVADAWHRLLTYKDEYEVARLHLLADYDRIAAELGIEGDYEVKYHLHPPALKRLGLDRKLPMGKPYALAFQALRRMKRLRGTKLDPFGFHPDRRLERELIDEYEGLVGRALDGDYDTAAALAASSLSIKGYDEIKQRSVAAWRERVATLLAE